MRARLAFHPLLLPKKKEKVCPLQPCTVACTTQDPRKRSRTAVGEGPRLHPQWTTVTTRTTAAIHGKTAPGTGLGAAWVARPSSLQYYEHSQASANTENVTRALRPRRGPSTLSSRGHRRNVHAERRACACACW
jgi:hypothetical protein